MLWTSHCLFTFFISTFWFDYSLLTVADDLVVAGSVQDDGARGVARPPRRTPRRTADRVQAADELLVRAQAL